VDLPRLGKYLGWQDHTIQLSLAGTVIPGRDLGVGVWLYGSRLSQSHVPACHSRYLGVPLDLYFQ